ncbi:SAM-dependent methyltransferase [Nonomuraea sp. NPDC049421]|uniref:SAM-dependent methyltransferase n=1 Tax=Nonomuraea sp. NPDC049421 TaxID=3155275 RepID=UPI003416F01B
MSTPNPDTQIDPPPGERWDAAETSPAATYAALRGSKGALPAARAAGDQLNEALGRVDLVTLENAHALGRAVRYAAERGFTQFADLGGGIPLQEADSWKMPDLCSIAMEIHPGRLRWLLVDSDELALTYGRAFIGKHPNVRVEQADLRHTTNTVDLLHQHLNMTQPVVCVLGAVLHFMTDREVTSLLAALHEHLAAGSLVIVTHVTSTGLPSEQVAHGRAVYERIHKVRIYPRTIKEITDMAGPFKLLGLGVVRTVDFMPPQGPEPVDAPHFLMWMAERAANDPQRRQP